MSTFTTHDEVFKKEITELYDAETRLVSAIGMMADAAADPIYKKIFEAHLDQAKKQIEKFELFFRDLLNDTRSITARSKNNMIDNGRYYTRPGRRYPFPSGSIHSGRLV